MQLIANPNRGLRPVPRGCPSFYETHVQVFSHNKTQTPESCCGICDRGKNASGTIHDNNGA
jgi:hypothetical protein